MADNSARLNYSPSNSSTASRIIRFNVDDQVHRRPMLGCIHTLLCNRSNGRDTSRYGQIAQRLEIGLLYQAQTLEEYMNLTTLHDRIHAYTVKSQIDRLTEDIDIAFESSLTLPGASGLDDESNGPALKKARMGDKTSDEISSNTIIFLGENMDLMRLMGTFLTYVDIVRGSMTCKKASQLFPAITTSIHMQFPSHNNGSTIVLPNFRLLEQINIEAQKMEASLITRGSALSEAITSRNVYTRRLHCNFTHNNMLKLKSLKLDYMYADNLEDQITKSIIETVVNPDRFPLLQTLSLVGNYIGDNGADFIADHLQSLWSNTLDTIHIQLKSMDLRNNLIGKRGKGRLETIAQNHPIEIMM